MLIISMNKFKGENEESMSEITILHLSDIHFRKRQDEKNQTFRQNVQTGLIDAIGAHVKEHGCPDFVAVTGDIAFAGKKHEYEEAWEFFEKLKKILAPGTVFLAVPGNHDVDRGQVSEFFSMHRIVKEGQTDRFLENKTHIKNFINIKFSAFRDFCRRLQPGLYEPGEKGSVEGEIIDDYFWVKNFEDRGVSFLGLNSAWASEGDRDRFQIALGYPQVFAALGKAVLPHRVILMHHPIFNWLDERDMQKWSGEVFNKCGLILHGHVHVDSAMSIGTPSDSCLSIGANATYTHEGYIGFQFIEARFLEDRVKVRVWPYKLKTIERPVFSSNYDRWIRQEGKPYFELETQRPCGGDEKDLRPLQIPLEYREWLAQFHSKMDIEQLDPNARAYHVPLPEVYIPIETVDPFYRPPDEKSMKERGKKGVLEGLEKDKESQESKESQYIDIEELLGREECILLRGPAGTGKTTLVKHLAYTITHGQGSRTLCDYLPIVVFLKDLWPIYQKFLRGGSRCFTGAVFSKSAPPGRRGQSTFHSLLKIYLETKVPALNLEVVERFLSRHRALFLLDGLDEVPEQVRRGLVEVIAGFRLENKNNRFLLTGRPHGIDTAAMQYFGEYLRDIEPLDNEKVMGFVANWFRVVSGQAVGLAYLTAAEMIGDIRVNPHVSVFTQNPLLLTAVCILYLDKKRLPDQRAELYCRIVENLIGRRFHQIMDTGKVSRIDDFLKFLAFHMQERNIKSIDVGEAKQLLKKIFPQTVEAPVEYNRTIDSLFQEIEPRCGLLKRPGEGEVEFLHLTFQEFLAARHMLYMDLDYRPFLEKPWWEETILLYTGLVNREWKDRANLMVKEILNRSHGDVDILRRLWLLGAKALRDIQAYKRDTDAAGLARKKLLEVIDADAPLDQRVEAGEILGILGDPRIKEYPMVRVEAGEFTMGGKEYGDEKPIHRVYLDEFMMGKYPVTNEEFKVFMEEGGYSSEKYWTKEGWKWKEEEKISGPGYWYDGKWNRPNFPVVGVSWYEAAAYAGWLSQKTGKDYRLPTEAQWEKAARGTDGREYPWGKDFDKKLCNSYECQLGRTSPVGIFAKGESPYGCLDMAGNVWEWCSDWFDQDYYKNSPDKNPMGPKAGSGRVLRGGCWLYVARSCRAAYRDDGRPAGRAYGVGFRLLRSL
jgi:formylglycine-generating enzyme required for sulfatase activity/calcineurin-like phosphoesterase family protein/energy-coupling factor transporter ATP-binding protein EcfA2